MKKEIKTDHVTKKEFEAFTKGTFIEFTEGLFPKAVDRLDAKIDSQYKKLEDKIDVTARRLDTKIENIVVEVIKTQHAVGDIRGRLASTATKQDIQIFIDTIDSLSGKYRGVDQEQMAQGKHIKEFREIINEHEKRITALEVSRPS